MKNSEANIKWKKKNMKRRRGGGGMYNHYNRHNGAKSRVEVKYYVTEFAEKSYRIGGYPPHLF